MVRAHKSSTDVPNTSTQIKTNKNIHITRYTSNSTYPMRGNIEQKRLFLLLSTHPENYILPSQYPRNDGDDEDETKYNNDKINKMMDYIITL